MPQFDLNEFPKEDVIFYKTQTLEETTNTPANDIETQLEENNSPANGTSTPAAMFLGNKRKNLTSEQKRDVYEMLLKETTGGILAKGAISKAAEFFSISIRSVSRIWHDAKHFSNMNTVNRVDFSSKLVKKVGRKKVQVDLQRVKDTPFFHRTNIRSLSEAINASKSAVHRRIKEGRIRPHTNALKPYLTDDNKKARLKFCLSMIDEGMLESKPMFVKMHDQIHIDEKWFFMSKTTQRLYLLPSEAEPHRTCKSKRFITKIMFLSAVAHPRFDKNTNTYFNGKIRIWAFVCKEPAKRKSKNRAAGTLETKPILSVTKDVIRKCLIEKVLPAIKEKWPSSSPKTIFIQQDNAKPHLDVNDADFVAAAREDGFDIRLSCQPPNGRDLNVLDLGFFKAIDTLQRKEAPKTIEEFILAVENAHEEFPVERLNNVFLTLQTCMVEVMRKDGGNNYKIPHMNKERLLRNGELPDCIEYDFQTLNEAKAML